MAAATVLTPAQVRALASPVRNEVYARLRALGQASANDLGRELSKSPESIHYHLRVLERVLLVREALRRATLRKPEIVFEATAAGKVRLPDPRLSPSMAKLNRRAVLAGMRMVMRGYAAASERAESTDTAASASLHVLRMNLRLRAEHKREFFRRLEELARFADESRAADGEGELLHWHSIVYPLR